MPSVGGRGRVDTSTVFSLSRARSAGPLDAQVKSAGWAGRTNPLTACGFALVRSRIAIDETCLRVQQHRARGARNSSAAHLVVSALAPSGRVFRRQCAACSLALLRGAADLCSWRLTRRRTGSSRSALRPAGCTGHSSSASAKQRPVGRRSTRPGITWECTTGRASRASARKAKHAEP